MDTHLVMLVVDALDGGGKTPVMPQYVVSQSPNKVVLRNFEGVITTYSERASYKDEYQCEHCKKGHSNDGLSKLLSGKEMALDPKNLFKHERSKKQIKMHKLME